MNNKKNYLDFIPLKNPDYKWIENEDGLVTVDVINKGTFNKIAQIFFKRPKVSHITLDEYGSFIWKKISGEVSVYDISLAVKEKFGSEAEPLTERLVIFFKMLQNNKFIFYKK